MIKRYSYKDLLWVDLEKPTRDEVENIAQGFGIVPSVAEELLRPSIKPRVELYPNCIYLILHFPAIRNNHRGDSDQEIDFVVGKKFLVTTHYDAIDPLHQFSRLFEVNSILDKSNIGDHAGFIFYYMMRELYRSLGNELTVISAELRDVEDKIFSGDDKRMIPRLSRLSRNLLDFKKSIGGHREMLESFELVGRKFFGEEFDFQLRAIRSEFMKVNHELESLRDLLAELRETNDSLVSTKQNEVMKVLTVVAFIGVPLSVISSLFQINTVTKPIIGTPNDFWIILGLELAIALVLIVYFKYKKWL